MIDLSKYYDMATLAEASYVLFDDLANFLDTTVKLALSDPNCNGTFSATQAADFEVQRGRSCFIALVVVYRGDAVGFDGGLFRI
jgi:hypothetical protein